MLLKLDADGNLRSRVPVTAGPRHNGIRSLTAYCNTWLLGGMANGPGTHSHDANPDAILADGFVREFAAPLE